MGFNLGFKGLMKNERGTLLPQFKKNRDVKVRYISLENMAEFTSHKSVLSSMLMNKLWKRLH